MTQKLALQAEERTKKPRATVAGGFVPAVIYGKGFEAASLQIETRAFKKVLKQAGTTSLISLSFGNDEHQVLIREVQYHPVRGHILHVDFYRVNMDQAIKAAVP